MRLNFGIKLLGGMAVVAVLAGCAASGPTIRVNQDPSASLAGYKTFNYFDPLGTDREGYESLVSNTLKDATTLDLTGRGYALSETPDFLVNFQAKLDDKLRVSSTPAMGPPIGYYGYRRGFYDPWSGYEQTSVDQYTQGTLNLDVVDARSKKLVWESVAEGRVTEKVRDNVPGVLRSLVPLMLAEFPSAN